MLSTSPLQMKQNAPSELQSHGMPPARANCIYMNFTDDVSAKSVDKMADFETLTLCISLNSSQMCTYFCKDLVTECCPHIVKNSIPNRLPFSN